MPTPPLTPPTTAEFAALGREFGLTLDAATLGSIERTTSGVFTALQRLDELSPTVAPIKYSRDGGRRPVRMRNPLNAWSWQGTIRGAENGVLQGKTVVVKDNIAVAGMPLTNGNALLTHYVPEFDATIVTRVLDAGGTIVGKATCENLCLSAGSHTANSGAVKNPHDPTRSSGGSSSGCAALLAAGEVDLALGGDQGGSIRTPAAWCGVYGLKPTWGLVPTTGAMPIAYTLDHLGPMARSASDLARLLSVIAGPDGHDPRTRGAKVKDYIAALAQNLRGLRIGWLREGFAQPNSDPRTNEVVHAALADFVQLGAEIVEVSIPLHYDAPAIWTGLLVEGAAEMMFRGNGQGCGWDGQYAESLIDAFGAAWHAKPDKLPETGKQLLLLGEYLRRKYFGRYQARAQNLRPQLQAAYDAALARCDVLAMPTIPLVAAPLPAPDAARDALIDAALNMQQNTCPFDASGHPALTLPCGLVEQMPVGLMLVGRQFDDDVLIAAAHTYQTRAYQTSKAPHS